MSKPKAEAFVGIAVKTHHGLDQGHLQSFKRNLSETLLHMTFAVEWDIQHEIEQFPVMGIFNTCDITSTNFIGLQRYIEHSSICGTTANEPVYRIATFFYTRFANLFRKDFMKKTLLFFLRKLTCFEQNCVYNCPIIYAMFLGSHSNNKYMSGNPPTVCIPTQLNGAL